MTIADLPTPKFATRQLIRVPADIHSSMLGTIAGMEWGTPNKHLPDDTWVYTIWWVDDLPKTVTEEILLAWQRH